MNRISELKIIPIPENNGHIGFVSFVWDNTFFLGSIGIFTRPSGGYRLTYPLRKNTRDSINFFYPINEEIGKLLEKIVTNEIERIIKENNHE